MRRIRQGMLAVMATALLGVSLAPGVGAQSPAPNALTGTDWLLSAVGTSPVASGTNANLLFADEDAGGFAGCNRFMAGYTTDGTSTLVFGPVATTMMLCDDATNAFEQSYLAALATVATYTATDTGLDLADASGAVVLSFGATAPASVEGPWIVRSLNNGNGGVETIPDGVGATFSFQPDGTIEGFGGCNGFGGGYSVDGDAIAIGPLMSTMMACGDPADTAEQQLLAGLQNSTKWAVVSGILELRDDAGALQVDATSAIGH